MTARTTPRGRFRRLLFAWMSMPLGALAVADEPVPAEPECVEVPTDPRPDCIEAVVLAKFMKYRPRPLPTSDPDEIIMSWTWDVDIDVREVYLGDIPKGKLTIGATLHVEFNHRLRQPVLFLTRKFGGWYLSRIEWAARGPDGLVIPVFDEFDESEFSPKGWKPKDAKSWLRPVRYRGRDVQAFEELYWDDDFDQRDDVDHEWARIDGKRQIARRGFRVADLPAMLKERLAVDCARQAR